MNPGAGYSRTIEELIDELTKEAKKIYSRGRKSHDWEHTKRVYSLCMHIGEKEAANLEVLKIAAILHDIGREKQDESQGSICHAEYGAAMAAGILKKYQVPEQMVGKIIECIETHRFRGDKKPVSLEAKVLYDADKLDGIGAIGIGRAFVFAGEIGAKVHNSDVDISNTSTYSEEDTAYREFAVKLQYVKDKMLTGEGKRMAAGRHQFMVDFFERLNKEVAGKL